MKFVAVVSDKTQITAIAGKLKMLGCKVEQVLKRTGVITGDSLHIPLETLQIGGIASIAPEQVRKAQ
ncbi:hypothetical protein [Flavihumibacter petaseus]|uniref:Uncharacterized protein n=1 Tax=Flavihumibacter petaseus NBRC 106054 TaxID=1220578 RepID=A0A0E9N125_9BACT|nr:hypothetical protein [Flavihumibacter petaseus]GAO43438.1 hypothetical protein FPE01S_02_05430 [Flavihumibacter petaseus NBRC 106054]